MAEMKRSQCGLRNGKKVQDLIDQGIAWFEEDELVAVAGDKTKISLGVVWTQKDLDRVEAYLNERPTPDMW